MTTPATCSLPWPTDGSPARAVIATFLTAAERYGQPQSTLTDNGSVYTSRFTGGRNGFEYLLASLGIAQKNRHPGHPQTQGKIERFHQTLKRWLAARPAAATVAELQTQLDTFTHIYNQTRPHRALHGATPAQAYAATIKLNRPGFVGGCVVYATSRSGVAVLACRW